MKFQRVVTALVMVVLLSSTAYAAELHITEAPEAEVETIAFEVPNDVPGNWFPLRQVAEYLPIEVSWDAVNRKIIIDSEPNRVNSRWLAHEEISVDIIQYRSKDLKIIDGVTYCSPRFLANHLIGVGFMYGGDVWYCNAGLNFDGCIQAALLELRIVLPEEYDFVNTYLTGGIQHTSIALDDALAYVYPYSSRPVCYIVDNTLSGTTLASIIAHEAWHVYDARRGVDVTEAAAHMHSKEVFNQLIEKTLKSS